MDPQGGARNRLKALHASVRRALRQAWELDDADKAIKLDSAVASGSSLDRQKIAAIPAISAIAQRPRKLLLRSWR